MKTITMIALLLVLLGCKKESQSSTQIINSEFQVEFLFEHDGCRVYRFVDHRTVYYTDCRGTTSSSYRSGKHTYYDDVANSGKK